MKKLVTIGLSLMILLTISFNVYAGDLNTNEKYIIDSISKSNFSVKIESEFINQLQNYFCQNEVQITKNNADDFILYLKEAVNAKREMGENPSAKQKKDTYIYFEKAGTSINLLLEYDSAVNDFYMIDKWGYIVLDFKDIIKDTDSNDDKSWNISIEMIFGFVLILCIIGLLFNLRRWNKKMKRKNKKRYESYEEEKAGGELEVADKKMRKARLQTFSYRSVIQGLRYFYIPIIMGLIVVTIGMVVKGKISDLTDSIETNFINTQPLYYNSDTKYNPSVVNPKDQPKTIGLNIISYPKYGEQYGEISCEKLKIDAPVFWGDRGNELSKGAGTFIGSMVPGMGKSVLIGAHDTTYFKGLENVKKGQEFTFTTTYGIYKYKVTKIQTAKKEDWDKMYDLKANKEQLVLYTCYPFGELNGKKEERMFVYLDKINGPDIKY